MGQGGDAPRTALTLCSPSPVFLFQVPPIEESFDDNKHSLKPWDTKKVGAGPLPHGGGPWGSRHRRVPCPCPCLLPAGERCDTGARSLLPAPKPRPARAGGVGHKHPGRVSLLLSDFTALLVLGPAALLRSPWDPVSAGLGSPDPGFLGLGGWRMVGEVILC